MGILPLMVAYYSYHSTPYLLLSRSRTDYYLPWVCSLLSPSSPSSMYLCFDWNPLDWICPASYYSKYELLLKIIWCTYILKVIFEVSSKFLWLPNEIVFFAKSHWILSSNTYTTTIVRSYIRDSSCLVLIKRCDVCTTIKDLIKFFLCPLVDID